jgi:hypothetical protein
MPALPFPHAPEVYLPCMSPHNYADCVGNDAVLSGKIVTSVRHLAQFGLTPKSKRRLAARAQSRERILSPHHSSP